MTQMPNPSLDAPSADVASAKAESAPLTRSRARWLWWLSLLLALAAFVASVAALRGRDAASEQPASDVPHVEDGKIVYSQSFKERVHLETAEVLDAPLTPVVAAVGTVTFDPRHVARVGTRLRGVVRAVRAFEGSQVKRGQTLALIDSPELAEAEAQVSMLRARANAAQNQTARQEALATHNLTTAREVERASAEEQSYESMLLAAQQKVSALAGGNIKKVNSLGLHTLVAPLDGTVVERQVTQGELVDGNEVAFVVAQLDHLWVELDVYERSLAAVRAGDAVTIQPLSHDSVVIEGRVAHVSSVIDERTRSAAVRVEVDNKEQLLRVGQTVDAKIRTAHATQQARAVIPAEAITFVDGKPTVFVVSGPSSVVPTSVELGKSDGKNRQILEGLAPGQRVVTRGVFELKSELFR
jgi:cobalt-zinc-cadmium efflux system membrane fusion protein